MSHLNPYEAPHAPAAPAAGEVAEESRLRVCPVCHRELHSASLLLPGARCPTCRNRLRLRATAKTRMLAVLTLGICAFASLAMMVAGIDPLAALLGSIATYMMITTTSFHLYGRPQLASWWGFRSQAALARARSEFAAHQQASEGQPSSEGQQSNEGSQSEVSISPETLR